MITKLGTLFARWCLQSSIYIAVFYNSDLMLDVCGPFTLSPDNMRPLLVVILLIEIFRIFFHLILTNLFKVPWLAKLFPGFKQICTLLLHLFIMTYTQHRLKYFIHTALMQAICLIMAIVLDMFHHDNIAEAGQIIFLDNLIRVAVVYEVTQTFCPNLILYYFFSSLVALCLSQMQQQWLYGFLTCLFVKHDVYRILFVSFTFFVLFQLTQMTTYCCKSMLLVVLIMKMGYSAVQNYNEGKLGSAVKWIFMACMTYAILQTVFAVIPEMVDTVLDNQYLEQFMTN